MRIAVYPNVSPIATQRRYPQDRTQFNHAMRSVLIAGVLSCLINTPQHILYALTASNTDDSTSLSQSSRPPIDSSGKRYIIRVSSPSGDIIVPAKFQSPCVSPELSAGKPLSYHSLAFKGYQIVLSEGTYPLTEIASTPHLIHLSITAKTIEIRSPLILDGSDVELNADNVIFAHNSYVSTTPAIVPPRPAEGGRTGCKGLAGGDLSINSLHITNANSALAIDLFRLGGGVGGQGSLGADGANGTTVSPTNDTTGHGYTNLIGVLDQGTPHGPLTFPTDGLNATPDEAPGDGGEPGILRYHRAVALICRNQPCSENPDYKSWKVASWTNARKGSPGLAGAYHPGGTAGQPNPAIKIVIDYTPPPREPHFPPSRGAKASRCDHGRGYSKRIK
jgi:hypothetical protein